MTPQRVLVIGGYGVFGRKLCERLLRDPMVELLIGGRSQARAETLVEELRPDFPGRTLAAVTVDWDGPLDESLSRASPALVIHTAGPFQGRDYRVAEACIAQGCHYIDMADGRDFVTGFSSLDAAAKAAGVLAVAGASSVPALSAAAADHLRTGFKRIDEIVIGITPGNRAPRGRAVVEAILSYSGKPLQVWHNGAWRNAFGWQGLQRRRLPGLGGRWFATCDVPDHALFPARYEGVRSVTFQAGLELSLLHLGLWALTWPVRWGLIGSLRPLTGLLLAVAKCLGPFGSDRGGMFVELTGLDRLDRPSHRRWSLRAGTGHGPTIPVVPAAILAGKLLRGEIAVRGARPCLDFMSLEEFREHVRDLDIFFCEDVPARAA
ncbi:hypothetical protein HBA54_09160 [Pelagibius litoralis]|uniref:Saccharopine dehydrogenase NADP binding domain-containing protein n=1 Tax=Pelagibius litoralis TaxID=374515 RepID=A0A967CC15_9PROT|nr:saccharopine dehydrogenase NADP-binding domain-containing protein [Pelagibius litoralis]NIA68758.1 hypothetical protein [Pelagibius litoralis]